MDGANMNANMGRMRPAEADVDIMHFNLHKTFSTPHGGGGPGCGAIACSEDLAPFLPEPTVEREGDVYRFVRPEKSIGRVAGFHGNFGQMLRAWNYIRMHGPELRDVTDMAVLNANYVRAQLRGTYRIPYDELCKHEVVVQSWPRRARKTSRRPRRTPRRVASTRPAPPGNSRPGGKGGERRAQAHAAL
jgi:glycine dehydrogenase subunit 2